MEAVITQQCYGGEEYEPPHVPEIFKKNIETLEKKKSEKGELYKKMKSMYEMSLPISLAFYASDKRSREWNKEHFSTKVDQKAYFECLCGGTEEARGERDHTEFCLDVDLLLIRRRRVQSAVQPVRDGAARGVCQVRRQGPLQGRVLLPSLLGPEGEGPVRSHTDCQSIQHQLPVDRGDPETHQT